MFLYERYELYVFIHTYPQLTYLGWIGKMLGTFLSISIGYVRIRYVVCYLEMILQASFLLVLLNFFLK